MSLVIARVKKVEGGGHMAPPLTFFTLAITRDIFMDPDPFVNSYFGLSFDLRRYLAQSDIFEVVKLGLKKITSDFYMVSLSQTAF